MFSAQLPLLLARRALNVCPDEGSSTWHDNSCLLLTCWLLGMLAIAIGEMVPAAHTDEDLVLDLARAQHFFRVMHDLAYEDAYDVLFVALPAVGTPVDLDEVVEARYGVTFRSLWAVTALMSLSYLKDREKARIVLDAARPEVKQAWLDLWSMTPAQAAEDWAGDTSAAPWDLSHFFKHPVIDLGPAEAGANAYLPIRSAFLAEKAILNEVLWIVADLLPADQRQALLAVAGRAFEEVAQRRVREFVGNPSLLRTEEQLKEWLGEPGGLCDLVVLYPDDWIAIEFVRHSLAKPTLTTGDYEDLKSDLEYGAIGELRQIDGTVSKMLRQRHHRGPSAHHSGGRRRRASLDQLAELPDGDAGADGETRGSNANHRPALLSTSIPGSRRPQARHAGSGAAPRHSCRGSSRVPRLGAGNDALAPSG